MKTHAKEKHTQKRKTNNRGARGEYPESPRLVATKFTEDKPVVPKVVHIPEDDRKFWRERGRRAFHNGQAVQSSPFRRAALSPYGMELSLAWEAGWKQTKNLTPVKDWPAPLREGGH